MRNEMENLFPRMPRPTKWGVIFNILMLASPFSGLWVGGGIGLLIGMSVSCIGWTWFFFIHGRRDALHGRRCELCGRPVINLGRGTPFTQSMNIGTFFNIERIRQGLEGPGEECLKCGRIYCSRCAEYDIRCVCGSNKFRTVRSQYGRGDNM